MYLVSVRPAIRDNEMCVSLDGGSTRLFEELLETQTTNHTRTLSIGANWHTSAAVLLNCDGMAMFSAHSDSNGSEASSQNA